MEDFSEWGVDEGRMGQIYKRCIRNTGQPIEISKTFRHHVRV
jgi:hypothetical protein